MNRLFLLLSSLFLASCQTIGPEFSSLEPAIDNRAKVYFIRATNSFGSARSINIHIDGKLFAELDNRRFTIANLEPGLHEFKQSFNPMFGDMEFMHETRKIEARLEAGKIYYVSFHMSPGSGPPQEPLLIQTGVPGLFLPLSYKLPNISFGFIEEQSALSELSWCYYSYPNKSTSPEK